MTWRLFIDDERFPSSKDYDMSYSSKELVALSIVLVNTTSRSGVRNDAYRNEVHAASMANLVRHGRVNKIEYTNETYYAITAKGRDYYEACTGHVVGDLLFEEDVCYA
jgi:hypothetical protein